MIDAIITVRAASTRLPNKCFLNIANRSVLKHVIERCYDNDLNPVIATTENDVAINELCLNLGVRCFAGSSDDKLGRWLGACRAFGLNSFVTVDCDDPLFSADLSKRQHEILMSSEENKVVSPDMDAYLGSNGWAFKTSALEEICNQKMSAKTEMIWKHFPDDLEVTRFNASSHVIEKDLRLTLDFVEDYWLILTVVRELGFNCTREQIIEFFQLNPGLRRVNDFRNEAWRLNQEQNV